MCTSGGDKNEIWRRRIKGLWGGGGVRVDIKGGRDKRVK